MKAKSIDSDVPGTFRLCQNRVSILVTSVLLFPALGNLPAPWEQRALSEQCDGRGLFNLRVPGPKRAKLDHIYFPKKQPSSQNVSARSDAIFFHDLRILAGNYHIIAFQHAQFPKIPLKAFPLWLCLQCCGAEKTLQSGISAFSPRASFASNFGGDVGPLDMTFVVSWTWRMGKWLFLPEPSRTHHRLSITLFH